MASSEAGQVGAMEVEVEQRRAIKEVRVAMSADVGEAEPPGPRVGGVRVPLDELRLLEADHRLGDDRRRDLQPDGDVAGTGVTLGEGLEDAERGAGQVELRRLAVGGGSRGPDESAEGVESAAVASRRSLVVAMER